MTENLYAPPLADLALDKQGSWFFSVSKRKFLIMMIATCGNYSLYWFYKNWALYREATGQSIWPVPRAIFGMFFIYQLFNRADKWLTTRNANFQWHPKALAWAWIAACIGIWISTALVMEQIIGQRTQTVIGVGIIITCIFSLTQALPAMNVAAEDPHGEKNKRLTKANYFWIVMGLLQWANIVHKLINPIEVIMPWAH